MSTGLRTNRYHEDGIIYFMNTGMITSSARSSATSNHCTAERSRPDSVCCAESDIAIYPERSDWSRALSVSAQYKGARRVSLCYAMVI